MNMLNTKNIPPAIEQYLAASDAKDAERFVSVFTEDALYHDEGKTYRGREAIRDWKLDFDSKLSIVNKLLGVSGEGDRFRMQVEASGNFPGSPQVFVYHITLDPQQGLIREMKIE